MVYVYGTDEKKRVPPHFYLLLPAPLEDFRPGYGCLLALAVTVKPLADIVTYDTCSDRHK